MHKNNQNPHETLFFFPSSSLNIQFLLQLRNFISNQNYFLTMDNPIEVNDDGVKLKPEIMEPEKFYHCIFKEKVILVFKDHQDFLNCFEIEEKELVDKISSSSDEDVNSILESYIKKEKLKKLLSFLSSGIFSINLAFSKFTPLENAKILSFEIP